MFSIDGFSHKDFKLAFAIPGKDLPGNDFSLSQTSLQWTTSDNKPKREVPGMDLGLTGKVALVTGSNRGTGQMIANQLSLEGATVFIHSLKDGESVEVASQIANSIPVWGDIRTDEGAQQVFDQVTASHALDILVNNYGSAKPGGWLSASTQDWIDIYQENTLSVARLVRLFVPGMREQVTAGKIINLGTIGSTRPNAGMPHYYASKGALANMTVSLPKELRGTGITVNLVSPGLIRTAEVEASFRKGAGEQNETSSWEDIEQEIVARRFPNPLGRIATREEVADLVTFLASDKANYINGQNIRIDGGAVDIV
jgi:NAD(P)-dependent dehydrogenase (short-subunit alcohol dehydrogenase family)